MFRIIQSMQNDFKEILGNIVITNDNNLNYKYVDDDNQLDNKKP